MRAAWIAWLLLANVAHAQDMEVHGSMPYEAIRRVVHRGAGGQIRQCYDTALHDHPRLEGRWIVRFVIAADGRTIAAQAQRDEAIPELESCVVAAVRALTFPSTGAGVVVVTWPFDFTLAPARPGIPVVRLEDRGPYVVRTLLPIRPLFRSTGTDDPLLSIHSTLEVSCEAFIDGVALGPPPLLVRLAPRTYRVEIRAAGYDNWHADIVLRRGRAVMIEASAHRMVEQSECALGEQGPGRPICAGP